MTPVTILYSATAVAYAPGVAVPAIGTGAAGSVGADGPNAIHPAVASANSMQSASPEPMTTHRAACWSPVSGVKPLTLPPAAGVIASGPTAAMRQNVRLRADVRP